MESIYYLELNNNSDIIEINLPESKHLKALRMQIRDTVFITNGAGLFAESIIISFTNYKYYLKVKKLFNNYNELPFSLGLGMGIIDSRERFEFALEKATELGVSDFYPLITNFSQKKFINLDRLNAKAVASIKQCLRARLPIIHKPQTLNEFHNNIINNYNQIIITDIDGEKPFIQNNSLSTIVIVGPEGGFSMEELAHFKKNNNTKFWNLGQRRLRTETAAISILSIITSL
jgi:16S rRNA (uracil1498-N3)-methyltransferase